jgi:hypothetical protein
VSTAIKRLEDAHQAAEAAVEELSEAQMALRRTKLRVQNLDPEVGPDDLERASSRVQYAQLVAEGTKQAAEKAATAQIEDEAREASAALFRDYPQQDHIEQVRARAAAAAAELATAVELIRVRNDAIRAANRTVARAKKALPEGSLPEFNENGVSLSGQPMAEMDLEDALAAAVSQAIGPQKQSEPSKHDAGWIGEIGARARKLDHKDYFRGTKNPFLPPSTPASSDA